MKRNVWHHSICMTRENNFKHVSGPINPIFMSLFHKVVLRKEKKTNSDLYSASSTIYQPLRDSLTVPFHLLVERGYFN